MLISAIQEDVSKEKRANRKARRSDNGDRDGVAGAHHCERPRLGGRPHRSPEFHRVFLLSGHGNRARRRPAGASRRLFGRDCRTWPDADERGGADDLGGRSRLPARGGRRRHFGLWDGCAGDRGPGLSRNRGDLERRWAGGDVPTAARRYAEARRGKRQPLPGFGHPLHKPVDPRAEKLLALAKQRHVAGRAVLCAKSLAALAVEISPEPRCQ